MAIVNNQLLDLGFYRTNLRVCLLTSPYLINSILTHLFEWPCSINSLWLLVFGGSWCMMAPGEGNSNPLQYSCLESPMDREPGEPQSMRSQRVGHGWSTNTSTHAWWLADKKKQMLSPDCKYANKCCNINMEA